MSEKFLISSAAISDHLPVLHRPPGVLRKGVRFFRNIATRTAKSLVTSDEFIEITIWVRGFLGLALLPLTIWFAANTTGPCDLFDKAFKFYWSILKNTVRVCKEEWDKAADVGTLDGGPK